MLNLVHQIFQVKHQNPNQLWTKRSAFDLEPGDVIVLGKGKTGLIIEARVDLLAKKQYKTVLVENNGKVQRMFFKNGAKVKVIINPVAREVSKWLG